MGNKLPNNDIISFRKDQFPQTEEQNNIDSFLFTQQEHAWTNVTEQNVYYRTEYGKFHVYRNRITEQQVEKYKVVLKDKLQYDKFSSIYKWRNNSQYLPKIEHIIILNQTQICVSQFELNLFIERIPLRLVDLTDIPFPQNLYFLTAILKGFKYILDSKYVTRMFRVTQSMIGVNMEGEVKVWWSSNMSEMESPAEGKKQGFVSEQQFVNRIIDLVEDNTDERDYPYPLRKYLTQRNIPINGDLTMIINQVYSYAKQMNITIPKCSFSVRDILKRDGCEESGNMESEDSLLSNGLGAGNENNNKGEIWSSNVEIKRDNNNNNAQLRQGNSNLAIEDSHNHKQHFVNIHQKETIPTFTITNFNNPIPKYYNHYQSQPNYHYHQVNSPIAIHNKQISNQKYVINRLGQNIIQFTTTHNNNNNTHSTSSSHHYDKDRHKHYNNEHYYNSSSLPPNNRTHNFINDRTQQHVRFVVVGANHNSNNNFNQYHNHNLLSYQISTPTFLSQPLKSNLPSPQIYPLIKQNNNNSINIQNEIQKKQFFNKEKPQQMITKHIELQSSNNSNSEKSMNESEQFHTKLKYYTRKDSQQTLDPQIASDLAKYLNQND